MLRSTYPRQQADRGGVRQKGGAHLRTIWNLIVVHPRELVDVVAVQTTYCQKGHHFGLSVLAIITRASQHETGGSKKKKREARKEPVLHWSLWRNKREKIEYQKREETNNYFKIVGGWMGGWMDGLRGKNQSSRHETRKRGNSNETWLAAT